MSRAEVYRQVAELHAANIDQGFLATMGTAFLSLIYEAIDECDEGVLLVEERDGRIIAFVAGATTLAPVYKRMLRRPVQLALVLLPSVFRPRRFRRLIETLIYSRGAERAPGLPEAELLSIAVSPAYRGRKIGDLLYARLVDNFRLRGVSVFKITVGDNLLSAHRFYLRMGALPGVEIEVHPGNSSTVYLQTIG